ncbi:MAG: GNAT family N-acetyltransferase [Acidobacteria bacterium]|nr:GNAT family N-acetyltransferase [Acidobacteriota bacterium]
MSETAKTSSSSPGVQGLLRIATAADVNAITPLINAAFVVERPILDNDRIDDAGVRDFMTRGEFLLIEDATGKLIACVFLEWGQDARCYLGLLSIAPERQGTGLGQLILAHAEDFARQIGCHTMWLRTLSARNPPLRPYYERFGYKLLEMIPLPPELHPKIPCEFVVMEKRLA